MSVYAETTEPLPPTKRLTVMQKLREHFKTRRFEIPLYNDDGNITKDEREYRCDSPACTALQYSLLTSCSLAVVGLIAYYSYVGYNDNSVI